MLVRKEYERPIDTVQDLIEYGLPMYIPARTSIYSALRDDSRESVQLLMKTQSKAYPFAGVNPTWVVESYVYSCIALIFSGENTLITFSVLNKTAVLVASRTLPMSSVHKSKEALFTVLNSFVMPKGNPMKVFYSSKIASYV